ncbi:MAG: sulfatase [Planctomycetaceae bacterium]|jgi:N-sulfoglucosamine sulfohydrolase|nr:sulfatase [Planctomycetaceae bacterium]
MIDTVRNGSAAMLLCCLLGVPATAANRNVVLFVVDDQGDQAGCFGNKLIRTPSLDSLAAAGTRFTRAYCTTASCSASRSVLMTGLYNHATGHYGHAHGYNHFSTYSGVATLPVLLAEAGYRTCSIGKYHLAPRQTYHFQDYRNAGVQGNRNAVRMANNAREWIAENDSKPFFLYFCTSDPHRGGGPDGFSNFNDTPDRYPGVTPVRYDPEKIVVPPWLPDQPEVRRELAEYYQAISRLDQGLGVLLKALKETGHWDDTLIVFLSDNGPPFPGAKTTLYEPGMNLPLIVRSPDQKTSGGTTDARVNWADITPTILDFCRVTPRPRPPFGRGPNGEPPRKPGKPRPVSFHGRSFLSTLDTPHPKGFDEIHASHTFHEVTMYYPMRVIISGRYKYIFNIAHQLPYPFASDLFASPTWQGVLRRKDVLFGKRTVYSYLHRPRHELYDLVADPDEITNMAYQPAQQERLKALQEKLKTWQRRTRDPWILKWRYE